jgi:hypothetical protein
MTVAIRPRPETSDHFDATVAGLEEIVGAKESSYPRRANGAHFAG